MTHKLSKLKSQLEFSKDHIYFTLYTSISNISLFITRTDPRNYEKPKEKTETQQLAKYKTLKLLNLCGKSLRQLVMFFCSTNLKIILMFH